MIKMLLPQSATKWSFALMQLIDFMSHGEMKSETPESLLRAARNVVLYLSTSGYFWASIGFTVAGYVSGEKWILENISATPIHLLVSFGLVFLAYFGIKKDVQDLKKRRGTIKRSYVIMIAVFVYVSMFSDAMQLEIEFLLNMTEAIGTEAQQAKLEPLGFQFELFGIFSFLPYPFFLHGNEMGKWLRKNEQNVSHYESYLYYESG